MNYFLIVLKGINILRLFFTLLSFSSFNSFALSNYTHELVRQLTYDLSLSQIKKIINTAFNKNNVSKKQYSTLSSLLKYEWSENKASFAQAINSSWLEKL